MPTLTEQVGLPDFNRPFNPRILTLEERARLDEWVTQSNNLGASPKKFVTALRSQIGKDFARRFTNGMVTYSNGNSVSVRDWGSMYSDTVTMNTMRRAQIEFGLSNGLTVGKVKASATACQICQPFDGTIVSYTGAHPGLDTVAEIRSQGWGHPHCQCIIISLTPAKADIAIKEAALRQVPRRSRKRKAA